MTQFWEVVSNLAVALFVGAIIGVLIAYGTVWYVRHLQNRIENLYAAIKTRQATVDSEHDRIDGEMAAINASSEQVNADIAALREVIKAELAAGHDEAAVREELKLKIKERHLHARTDELEKALENVHRRRVLVEQEIRRANADFQLFKRLLRRAKAILRVIEFVSNVDVLRSRTTRGGP